MITNKHNLSLLFDFGISTIYKWRKENRPIINLLEKYFTDKDLEEFLETGKIKRYDNIPDRLTLTIVASKKFWGKMRKLGYKSDIYKICHFLDVVYYLEDDNLTSFGEKIIKTYSSEYDIREEDMVNILLSLGELDEYEFEVLASDGFTDY